VSAQNGDNVLRTFYKVAGEIAGVELSEYDLSFTDSAVKASIFVDGDNMERTAIADQIEAEDRALEEKKRRRAAQKCEIM